MRPSLFAAATAIAVFGFGTLTLASDRCNVPMAEWQPREALQRILEEKGWQVHRIKTDDGCYKAYAVTETGKNVKAYFDPKTLAVIDKKDED